jgi:nucleotide-binding universal stress UspA family protein
MIRLKRILVPIDFSGGSLVAAADAGVLARHFRSEITALHVRESFVLHPLTSPSEFGIASGETEQAADLWKRREQLEKFAATEFAGVSVNRLVCCGDPAKVIVERARSEKSDLILMSTHGSGTFRRLLLGSVTAKVLHDAECPVWTGAHFAAAPAPLRPASNAFCAR